MSSPLPVCRVCGQSFWSAAPHHEGMDACPACQPSATEAMAAGWGDAEAEEDPRPRFVSLSALPPEKRLPPRRDGKRPGLMVPRRLAADRVMAPQMAPSSPPPRPAPAPPPAPVARKPTLPVALPVAPPVLPPPAPVQDNPAPPARQFPEQQLGFNCPSCFVILVIKDPGSYDGRAAPCPHCGVAILPPRVAPASPFSLMSTPAGSATPALPPSEPAARPSRLMPFNRRHDARPDAVDVA